MKYIIGLLAVAASVVGIAMLMITLGSITYKAEAQSKPFSVYRSGNACIYIGYGAPGTAVDIEVVPIKELFLYGQEKGC